ncbi:MAG: FTR1 family protein [bacterium]
MIAIAFITFRESLEILILGSILFTSLKQFGIDKKRDLLIGAVFGVILSVALFVTVSFAGSQIHFNVGTKFADIFEGINYMASGVFLFITAILIHKKMKHVLSPTPAYFLDTSLFVVGLLSVLREGIEIVAFSFSSTIVSPLPVSLFGFVIGISLTLIVGIVGSRFVTTHLSHKKLLVVIDWGIKLLSLYFVIKGGVVLSEFII